MRHAPFYGWIHDLSAPDPALWLTGFGLVPWDVPQFLAIGVWPVLMGLSMFLQQRLNPQATDPTQQKIFAFMPVIFTFMLAQFPVGLVIYYTWSNLLTMTQQWVILKRVERQR
jgi:YidC/Oxa1 family membrane protein insertase